ncbi:hypothetical protein DR864_29275 (plasmid) [Runella rosea]|uniref:Signal transduction histidine kinase internal region domain-containing protein n=1 Tax=Runella rosea TaxID=2259595 RepID=A0A344TTI6_9BACT|nr:histidine kinase [Runella rosea]AXE21957.1 hypothetical protein DR864_29275 [Runella rosea]
MMTSASSLPIRQPILSPALTADWTTRLLANRVAYHILFWGSVFGFNAAYIAFIGEDRDIALFNLGLRIPFILAGCYINLYYLMPRFFNTGNFLLYALAVFGLIFSLNAVNLYVLELFIDSPICPTTFEADATFNGSNYIYKGFYLVSIVGLTSGIKLSKNQLTEKQKAEAIEKEKLQTELLLLKSQINPHFFFNTLNNLYALTLKKSDRAPEMVLKLSDLMSYSLYESDGLTVSLDKEISHIRNYIELETVRLGTKMTMNFVVNGPIGQQLIPPLLFLPIIENCFKHSATNVPGGVITVSITITPDTILLETRNPSHSTGSALTKKGGLGLRNVQRRLQLLYGSDYRFETGLHNETFSSTLQIPLVWPVV